MDVDWSYPRVLLLALLVVTVGAIVVAASTSTAAFGAFNSDWDGTADLRDRAADAGASTRVLLETAPYSTVAPHNTTALVLAPTQPYGNESARVRSFVRAGGTLVVADDFGSTANALLAAVGATARVNGTLLRDERQHYRAPTFPTASAVTNASVFEGLSGLTLNYGSVVEPNGASVLVRSSEYSYLDRDGNGEISPMESLERYPVVTRETVGNGTVFVVSDPSVFINAMLERPGNRAFVTALLTTDQVLLDYSHAGSQPPLRVLLLTVRDSTLLQAIAGLGLLGAVGAVGPLITRWQRYREPTPPPEPDGEAVADALAAAHPEWDRDRIERVTTGIMSAGRDEDTDEWE